MKRCIKCNTSDAIATDFLCITCKNEIDEKQIIGEGKLFMKNYCICYVWQLGTQHGNGYRIITAKNIREANDIITNDCAEGEVRVMTSVYSEPIPGPSGFIS